MLWSHPSQKGFFRDLLVFSNWLIMNTMGIATTGSLQEQRFSQFDRRGARAKAQSTPPCSFNLVSNAPSHCKCEAFASVGASRPQLVVPIKGSNSGLGQ